MGGVGWGKRVSVIGLFRAMLHLKNYNRKTINKLLFRNYRAKTNRFGYKLTEENVSSKGELCLTEIGK